MKNEELKTDEMSQVRWGLPGWGVWYEAFLMDEAFLC